MRLVSGQMRANTMKRIREAESVGGGLGFAAGPFGIEERFCFLLKAGRIGIKRAGFMFGFGEHLGLTAADNEEADFRFFFAAHAYRSSKSC